jgi:hypothetical protein
MVLPRQTLQRVSDPFGSVLLHITNDTAVQASLPLSDSINEAYRWWHAPSFPRKARYLHDSQRGNQAGFALMGPLRFYQKSRELIRESDTRLGIEPQVGNNNIL